MSRIGVIDIGTVTVRLALSELADGQLCLIERRSTICNLGEDVDKTGKLHVAAMERVRKCCAEYCQLLAHAQIQAVCVTLTSAARDAQNGEELLASLRELGLEPQIISGELEGMLTFWGVSQDFADERICVCDSGGGSTEFVIGSLRDGLPHIEFVHSADIGCRRITERCLQRSEIPTESDMELARAVCRQTIEPAVPWAGDTQTAVKNETTPAASLMSAEMAVPSASVSSDGELSAGKLSDDRISNAKHSIAKPERLVAVAGTVTTLVALSAQLEPYDSQFVHLHELSLGEVKELITKMRGLSVAERAVMPGIQPQRAPVILGGAIVIEQIMEMAGYESLIVSESDLLAGLSLAVHRQLEEKENTLGWFPLISQPDFV